MSREASPVTRLDLGRWIALVLALIWITACSDDAVDAPAPPAAVPATGTASQHDGELATDGEAIVELGAARPIRGRVVVRSGERIPTFNPVLRSIPAEHKILTYYVNSFLLAEHPDELETIPWLAASKPVAEDDGLAWIWTIKDGATWTDGRPVTADDAVFTWSMIAHPALALATAALRAELGPIQSVEALDERRFRVRYDTYDGRAVDKLGLGFGLVPRHASPASVGEFESLTTPLSCGPYVVKKHDDDEIVLERKLDWWGDAHEVFANRYRVRTFVLRSVLDSGQLKAQLERGEIDVAAMNSLQEWFDLEGPPWSTDFEKACYIVPNWTYLGWNCEDAIFSDRRVRTAMSHLIPRKKINDTYYRGLAEAVSGPFFCRSIYYDHTIEAHRFSVVTAKRLLAEAGWEDRDGDGRLDRDGRPFEFTLSRLNADLGWINAPLEHYRDALAQIGITMHEERLDQGTLFARARDHGVQAFLMRWSFDASSCDFFAEYHSSQRAGGLNWQNFANEELDGMLERMRSLRDDVQRTMLAHRIHRLIHEEQPMTFLFSGPGGIVWNRRVKGVQIHALGMRQWDFWVEKD